MKGACTAILAVVVSSLAAVSFAAPAHAAARRKPTVEFRPVLEQVAPAFVSTTTAPVDLAAAKATVASCDVAAVGQLPVIPTTSKRAAEPDACVVFPDKSGGRTAPRYYLGPAGDLPVADAKSQFLSGQGWIVKIDFTKGGSKAWDRLAEQQFHQQVAITYEGVVVAAPTIQPSEQEFTSFDGVAKVSGAFTQKEAVALAAAAELAEGR